jgi:hypothetical protein
MAEEALVEYLTFQNLFHGPETLVQGIRLLPAGSWMRIGPRSTAAGERKRYWDFHFAEPEKQRTEG